MLKRASRKSRRGETILLPTRSRRNPKIIKKKRLRRLGYTQIVLGTLLFIFGLCSSVLLLRPSEGGATCNNGTMTTPSGRNGNQSTTWEVVGNSSSSCPQDGSYPVFRIVCGVCPLFTGIWVSRSDASYLYKSKLLLITPVEPVKLNTCVHWTPAYIEQFFTSRQTPIGNQWEGAWIHWTPVYLEHWTPNLFPRASFNLSTLNILHWFETFHWKWGQMRYIRLTVLLSDIIQMLNIWCF